MSLRNRFLEEEEQQGTKASSTGRATWAAPFTTPIHGEVDGQPVRILQIGDMPGKSPVYLVVDEEGLSGAVALRDVTITDGACLPLARSARRARQESTR